MNLLLDTHTFIWFAEGSPSLSAVARNLILDPLNESFLSPASYWEIAIQVRTGAFVLAEPYAVFMLREVQRFNILHITADHTTVVSAMPLHHRDPFDRLLIAQAIVERMPILSRDAAFAAYPVTRLW